MTTMSAGLFALLANGAQPASSAVPPPAIQMIVVEAENLDGALAVAQELQDTRTDGAIEVRPIFEALFRGA